MKKIISLMVLFLGVLSLSGCGELVTYSQTTATTKTEKSYVTESPIDYNALVSSIYSEVQSKVESDLYNDIYDSLIDEFSDGIDVDNLQHTIYDVVNKCSPGNLGVTTYVNDSQSGVAKAYATGSAVVYEKETLTSGDKLYRYYFITNHHVVTYDDSQDREQYGDAFKVVFEDDTAIDATLIGSNKETDIAVLYFDSDNTYTVNTLGTSADCKVGDIVLAIGNPKGESLYGTVTFGIIGGLNRNIIEDGAVNTTNEYIQHDAAINSGNSGGGLYNLKGECIGINSLKYAASDIEGLGFAIPIDLVKEVASQIRTTGTYDGTVRLGISITSVEDVYTDSRSTYNIPDGVNEGVVVISITEGSTCAGVLQEYDIITKIGDTEIKKSTDLQKALKNYRIGNTTTLTVLRDGVEQTLSITFKRTEE